MLQAVGIVAVAAILGTARGLHISGIPRLGAKCAQGGRRMEGARPHFHVVGLQQDATLTRPIGLQREDQVLKRRSRGDSGGRHRKVLCALAFALRLGVVENRADLSHHLPWGQGIEAPT